MASRRLTVGTPQDSGGRKVDSGCIHDGNREGLSGDHEMHEQHVRFHVSDLVTLGQENGCSAPRKLFCIKYQSIKSTMH